MSLRDKLLLSSFGVLHFSSCLLFVSVSIDPLKDRTIIVSVKLYQVHRYELMKMFKTSLSRRPLNGKHGATRFQ